MAYLHGKFVWFEHMSTDVERARAFYDVLLGWHTESMPMGEAGDYPLIRVGAEGIGGLRKAPAGTPAHWMSYLSVADVDASHAAALGAGATSLMPPTDFAPVGRGAVLCDPTGAVFSIWTSAQGDRADLRPAPAGDWIWNELVSTDAHRALAFYTTVFGYTHDAMDLGELGSYHVLKAAGTPRAGLMQVPDPSMPSTWLPYAKVADCDATAGRAVELGGQVMMPPKDIEGVGRIAVVIDPLGGALAVMRPAPRAA